MVISSKKLLQIENRIKELVARPNVIAAQELSVKENLNPWRVEFTGSLIIRRDTELAVNSELEFYYNAFDFVPLLVGEIRELQAEIARLRGEFDYLEKSSHRINDPAEFANLAISTSLKVLKGGE